MQTAETTRMWQTLNNALTEYDRKQSTKRGYNRNALAHYLGGVTDVCNAVNCGSTRRDALEAVFNDRVLDVCLKALNMDLS